MYESYWNLSSLPFQNVSTASTYYPSSVHEEARARFFYAVSYDKGGALFTGEVGTGKTTVSNVIVKRLLDKDYNVGVVSNPTLGIIDFLREILFQWGVRADSTSKFELLHLINDTLIANQRKARKTILIVDEAHLITDLSILEEIRLLLNLQHNDMFLLTLILVGQPELRKIISSVPPLEQRISIKFHLKHLSQKDTKNYIHHRIKSSGAKDPIFTNDAVMLIHSHTDGIPRRINQVCDLSLLIGYADKRYCVDVDIVKKAMADEAKHKDES